jgi:creatinine amidohydrolase
MQDDIVNFDQTRYAKFMWEKLTWREIEKCATEDWIVVIPLGSVEQHGPMLPVECDCFLASSWCREGVRRALERHEVKAIICPTVPFGVSTEHVDFAGTISIDLSVYIALIQNIIREVIRSGFKKIVCISGHGGNIVPCKALLRDLKSSLKKEGHPDISLYLADDLNCFKHANDIYGKIIQGQLNFHADACETSYYLYLQPEQVRKKEMVKPILKKNAKPIKGWFTKEITETGASGDPSKANVEFGKLCYEYFPDAICEFLKQIKKDK